MARGSDRLRTDLRYAARLLVRSPGWTAVAILSLALGIGGNAVAFSLVDAVLLRPFPYRDSDRLVLIWGSQSEDQTTGISGADLTDWRQQSQSFAELDAFLGGNLKASLGTGEHDRVPSACIGPRVLPLLGVQPAIGRNFTDEDARFGATPVVLLSDSLWRSRYASHPGIVGTTIRIDDTPHEVLGVMPPGFFFPDTDARLWIPTPCGFSNAGERGAMVLHAVGRLQSGVSLRQAQSDLDRVNRALAQAYPETNQRRTAGIFPLHQIVLGKYEQALWVLVWTIGLVLLMACANVVHLLLARGVDRETELAIRGAAGASRRRLLRQLLTEGCLLVSISAAVGLLVAWIGIRLIHGFALTDIPRMEQASLDARVLAFTLVLSVLTAVVSNVWPAWKASGISVSDTLKLGATATTGASRRQLRDLLAVSQLAAAVTLLVASGLVVKSFVLLSRSDWGFNPANLLLIDVEIPRTYTDRASRLELTESILGRLRAVPGVQQVTVGYSAPIRWAGWSPRPLAIDGAVRSDLTSAVWTVGRSYFTATGVPVLEGRDFSEFDDHAAPKRVILSQSLANELWPNESALGKKLQILAAKLEFSRSLKSRAIQSFRGWPTDLDLYDAPGGSWEVIGVVRDVRMFGLQIEGNPALYVERRQAPREIDASLGRNVKAILRTDGPAMVVVGRAKNQILAVDKDLKFTEIVSFADLVAQSIGGRGSNKLLVIVATVFGTLALTFAAIGVYGVVAHNVTERLREIGIRVALGAARRDVVRIVLGYGLRLLVSGLALGVTIAWAATRGMTALLFATTPLDGITYSAVIAALTIAALLACSVPLRRALRFDPVVLFKA